MPRNKGKQPAANPTARTPISRWDPVICEPTNAPIVINQWDRTLVIEDDVVPGAAGVHRATIDGRRCVAIKKTNHEALQMYSRLVSFSHANVLKPTGYWEDQQDNNVGYITFPGIDGALSLCGQMIFKEGIPKNGFSEQGFKMFRGIFSAIHRINSHYAPEGTSSASVGNDMELLQIMLEPQDLYYKVVNNSEVLVLLGNLKSCPEESTCDDLEAAQWKEIGCSLKSLFGDNEASMELIELARFLAAETENENEEAETVSYDGLLWQPGLWDANIKMEFIREIFSLIDVQRDWKAKQPYTQTEKGKERRMELPLGLLPLMQMFPKPPDDSFTQQGITEKHMLQSVLFLRHTIVAHYDEQYDGFTGPKDDIGTSKDQIEMHIQSVAGDYMIKLAKTIRKLGWVDSSPLLRDQTNYMEAFYNMKIDEIKNAKGR